LPRLLAKAASGGGVSWSCRRIFLLDVLACPCGGRRRVIAFLTERSVITAILVHLGLPTTGPPIEPARGMVEADLDPRKDDVPE
jgi:hypothetical protein